MTKHVHDEVIRAYLDGKTVQWKDNHIDIWKDAHPFQEFGGCLPTFLDKMAYRIKPTKKKGWMNLYKSPGHPLGVLAAGRMQLTKEDADNAMQVLDPGIVRISCIEIEWEET